MSKAEVITVWWMIIPPEWEIMYFDDKADYEQECRGLSAPCHRERNKLIRRSDYDALPEFGSDACYVTSEGVPLWLVS